MTQTTNGRSARHPNTIWAAGLLLSLTVAFSAWAEEVREKMRLPAPTTVSDEAKAILNGPPIANLTHWVERSDEEWAALRDKIAQRTDAAAEEEIQRTGVSLDTFEVSGVTVRELVPQTVASKNKNRVAVFLHGGAYYLSPGLSSVRSAATAAELGGLKIWVPDYRMPPEWPFPTAVEDAVAVYRHLLESHKAEDIAVYGSSAGGGLTLAMLLMAHEQGLDMPAVVGLISPWSDLTDAGDSYTTLERLDPVLISYEAGLKGPAELYAGENDMRHPLLSPIYGEYGDWFPPTYLVTGTRDLFLSNTVRMHRKLREADVPVQLDVFEGMWHGFAGVPEKELATIEMLEFFQIHFGEQRKRFGLF